MKAKHKEQMKQEKVISKNIHFSILVMNYYELRIIDVMELDNHHIGTTLAPLPSKNLIYDAAI